MNQIDKVIEDLKNILKRRKRLLIIIPLLMLVMGIGASYLITPKYMSSISILVQKEETLNPLILYEMAVNIASEDRLVSFNKIIYSRSTVEMLIDSLNLDKDIKTNLEKQRLIEKIQGNIATSLRASDSFDISYYDSDPARAQKGVGILAEHFIKTRLKLENRRNEETVEFFESKLKELEQAVAERRENILSLSKQRLKETPNDNTALRIRMQGLDREIESLDQKVEGLQAAYDDLNSIDLNKLSALDIEKLYNVVLLELPFTDDLRSNLREYDALKQNFTMQHPDMKSQVEQIKEIASRIPPAIQSELSMKQMKLQDLKNQRKMIISTIQEAVVAERVDQSTESDYSIYQDLYNDMKVKLEQAKTTRDLAKKAADQFIVIDPPFYPEEPVSPNRVLITIGSLFAGIFLAIVVVVAAEIFDSTIRREDDIIDFDKPVIAFITDGSYS